MVRDHIMTAALAVLLLGCGARATVGDGPHREPPVLPPGAAPLLADCAPPLVVPAGRAWIGGMRWHGGKLEPLECDPPGEPGTVGKRVFVPDVFLDPDEATNACYRHCVEAGACLPPHPASAATADPDAPQWDDPAMQRVAAQKLDHEMAETFCAWRGGRLASLAELMRTEHGEAVAVVNQALTELWLACAEEPAPEPCAELWARVYSWPAPVRSWELDRGPFGHYDLAGSAVELTMTRLAITEQEEQALCAMPLDSPDPRTLGSGNFAGFFTAPNIMQPPTEGSHVGWVVQGAIDEGGHPIPLEGGVRCAYDAM